MSNYRGCMRITTICGMRGDLKKSVPALFKVLSPFIMFGLSCVVLLPGQSNRHPWTQWYCYLVVVFKKPRGVARKNFIPLSQEDDNLLFLWGARLIGPGWR